MTKARDEVDADGLTASPRSPIVTYESDDPGAMLGGLRTSPPVYAHHRRSSLDWTALSAAVKSSTTVSTCSDAAGKLQTFEKFGVVGRNVRQAR